MTREEAISWLVSLTEHEGEDVPIYDTDVEALDMAISALEHPERNVVAIVPCGDTISRQAVIDLMMQKWGENFSGDDAMQECIDAIRVMPSVTPQEPQSFKWCTDCKEYDTEKHCCHRYSKVIRDTVAEIRQEPILDDIRLDIKAYTDSQGFINISEYRFNEILDKYKAESEE